MEVYLHAFITFALDGGERSISFPGHFTPGEFALTIYWTGCMDPTSIENIILR
jgi:hypothetical protein